MNWRAVTGITLGLLLPVPLMWVLMNIGPREVPIRVPEGVQVSPMLSPEAQSRLMTYERDCRKSTDCEAPLACLADPRVRKSYCTDSLCVMDAQCPEGFACTPLRTAPGSPAVRYCIPRGLRREGERCISIPSNLDSACQAGLLCAEGWCGRPCQKNDLESCPAGFFCADTIPGPACRPTHADM